MHLRFLHAFLWLTDHFFLLLNNIALWIFYNLFARSPIEGYLDCFQAWQLEIKLLYLFMCRFFNGHTFSKHLGKYLGAQLLDGVVILYELCKKLPYSFPKWLYYLAFSPVVKNSSCCSTFTPAFDATLSEFWTFPILISMWWYHWYHTHILIFNL